jgi:hypothetical protein
MKTHITLRSTFSNTSWFQRGAAALLLAVVILTLTLLALLPNTPAPVAPPVVRQAAPAARNPNVPISGTGSAYDGGHYGSRVPAPRASSNVPISGTGSAYDGGHYGAAVPVLRTTLDLSTIGTGSVYDGGHYNGR